MTDLSTARALIFDCDGTLVDTPPLYARAWAHGFRPFGVEMSPAWYLERAGMSEAVLIAAFERDHAVKVESEHVVTLMRAALLREIHLLRPIDAIADIARAEFGKRPMAVASGGSRAIVTASLETTGLIGLFAAIVTIEDVAQPKPAPDLFTEAARRLNTPNSDCLVFEDSGQGLEAARRAGMHAIDVASLL